MYLEEKVKELMCEVRDLKDIVKELTYKVESKPMNTKEACDYLNCSRQTLLNKVNAGLIVAIKKGKNNLYRKQDLDQYLANG